MSPTKKIVTVCSKFDNVMTLIQERIGDKYNFVEVKAPLTPSIIEETDYLVADFPNAVDILLEKPGRLKWIQGTWAGIDHFTKYLATQERKPELLVSRMSHPLFSQLMNEYTLLAVLSIERRLKEMRKHQEERIWDPSGANLRNYRGVSSLTIGILGVGEIGLACASMFKGMGSIVLGLVNSPRERDDTVSRYFVREELAEMLSSCDYIINILPATTDTNGILSNDVLKSCRNAGFINIGRGNVCTDQDIVKALDSGWLREAFLDVFFEEPLPKASPLWSHPKVTVTPHVAAKAQAESIAECFVKNVERVEEGQLPVPLIDWNKLY